MGRVCERTGLLVGAVRRAGSMPDCRALQRPRGPVISQTLRGGPLRALAGVAPLTQTRVWAAIRALACIPQRSRRGPGRFCRGSLSPEGNRSPVDLIHSNECERISLIDIFVWLALGACVAFNWGQVHLIRRQDCLRLLVRRVIERQASGKT